MSIALACVLAVALWAMPSAAALTTTKCLAGKARAAGSFRKCRIDAEAKLLEGKDANLMKCDLTFAAKRAKLDAKAAKAKIACRFHDNGDGTVTDYDTGLQWEKKNSPDGIAYPPNPHDIDNVYEFSLAGPSLADGSAFTDFLGRLNGSTDNPFDIQPCVYDTFTETVSGGFAGRCDWRLPTMAELEGLFGGQGFLGLRNDGTYLASSSQTTDLGRVWYADYGNGVLGTVSKTTAQSVVAVRGGW